MFCEKIREEHRAAIDWLNKNSKLGVGFFAFEIKLNRIGDSDPAFDVICKPDEWSKLVKSIAGKETTETQQLRQRFWSGLKEYMEKIGSPLRPRKPWPGHWNKTYAQSELYWAISLVETSNGGYAIAGYNRTGFGDFEVKLDVRLFKTDESGNMEWTKTY